MAAEDTKDVMLETPPDAPEEQAPAARRRFDAGTLWQTVGPFAVFVALFVVIAALQPAFVGGGGIAILAVQATSVLLVALGQAMVLHVGSIDLSNAAIAIFAAILLALTLGPLGVAAIVVVLVIAALVGAVNGWIVAYTQVPSFALTLGTLGILTAASLVVSDATTVYVTSNSELLAPLFGSAILFLPTAFWVALIADEVMCLLL
jgi:ribose transport system permease protein